MNNNRGGNTYSYTNTQYRANSPKSFEVVPIPSTIYNGSSNRSSSFADVCIIRFQNGYVGGVAPFGSACDGSYCQIRNLDDDDSWGIVDYAGEGRFLMAVVPITLYAVNVVSYGFQHYTSKEELATLDKGKYYRLSHDSVLVSALEKALCLIVEPQ